MEPLYIRLSPLTDSYLILKSPHPLPIFTLPSLAARLLWRIHKDTGIVSDSQLISVDQLEDHVADMSEDDLKKLKTDVHTFQEFWSYGSKHHSVDYISHIFGIVSMNVSLCNITHQCFKSYITKL